MASIWDEFDAKQTPFASPGDSLLTAVINVGLSFALGYAIYRVAAPRAAVSTPTQLGRKWFAWMAAIATVALMPRFFRTLDLNSFAVWLLNLIVWGGMAFLLGWVYGKFFRFKDRVREAPAIASSPPEGISTKAPVEQRLIQLEELRQKGLISDAEFAKRRGSILDEL